MQYRGQANRVPDAAQRSAEDLSPAKRCAVPTEQDAAQLSAENLSPAKCCAAPTEQDAAHLSAEDLTAGINQSNTAVRAVLKQPCLTGGRTGTVRPKHLPAGRTGLSDQFLGPVAQDQPGPVGQICPTSWLLLRSDSVRPTTGRTWLFEHRSSSRVRPVNAGSASVPRSAAPRLRSRMRPSAPRKTLFPQGAAPRPAALQR
ncbi:hypothetical protein PCASD_13922 [Puccinia coronata f. sp. avenae]|uniref:Uncharacterized protein n=1 Tax=Puccinia coronata f. sp. avenae TaxID=200324 RepID=A0A2N5UHB4_9BASI|nr:hypothetical protein PCASD_13922 [Puccinia coronata f. sp. avenae]